MNGNNPWMVALRIGNHGVVAGSRHFKSWEHANAVRQNMLASPSVRAQPMGSIGVVVLHYKKFQELQEKGDACTIARLKANSLKMPDLAMLCEPVHVLDTVDVSSIQRK